MRIVICICVLILAVSCASENKEVQNKKEKKQFELYKSSEMASLMRQMHHINSQLKKRIEAGDELGEFPENFAQILQAKLTDNQEIDTFFKEHATAFLDAQKAIYSTPEQAKTRFNATVETCLECHRVKCAGPIPKIEQLFIRE